MKKSIPEDIQSQARSIIAEYNNKVYKNSKSLAYFPVFKGDFLYLHRKEGKSEGPIARLRFMGKIDDWEFAIFKWSSERYDPNEDFFPGIQLLDGTIEGAMQAGDEAYPPKWTPKESDFHSFLNYLLKKK
jgi:hypothetical protein